MTGRTAQLEEPMAGPGLQTFRSMTPLVDSLTGVERCIAEGLVGRADADEWGRFEQYVFRSHTPS